MALQYVSAVAPQAALAAAGDPVIIPDPTPNGCNGVLPTPGSENTHKRLIGGDPRPRAGRRSTRSSSRSRRRMSVATSRSPTASSSTAWRRSSTSSIRAEQSGLHPGPSPSTSPRGPRSAPSSATTPRRQRRRPPRRQATARPARPASSSAATSRSSRRTRPAIRCGRAFPRRLHDPDDGTRSFQTRSSTASQSRSVSGGTITQDVVTDANGLDRHPGAGRDARASSPRLTRPRAMTSRPRPQDAHRDAQTVSTTPSSTSRVRPAPGAEHHKNATEASYDASVTSSTTRSSRRTPATSRFTT